jgi:hypothetical protein
LAAVLAAAVSSAQPTQFGFSWPWPFRREKPPIQGLDFLGFPWILSSESRFFNRLCGTKRGSFFLAPSARWEAAPGRERVVEAMRKRRIVHGTSLPYFLIFCNQLSLARSLSPLNQKRLVLPRVKTRSPLREQLRGCVDVRCAQNVPKGRVFPSLVRHHLTGRPTAGLSVAS